MAFFVEIFVIFSLNFSILFRRDNRLNTRIFRTFNNFVRIVAAIGQQNFTRQTFDQRNIFFTVSSWAISNNGSDRHTKRIQGQMNFCVEPPFVRPIPSLPPIAPAACGRTLQWLASIINHSKSGRFANALKMRSQTPASRHRRNRWCTLPNFPNSFGKSRQGAPVLKIHKTAFINNRLSFAMPPHRPFCPGKIGAKTLHCSSVKSCLCKYLSLIHSYCSTFYDLSIFRRHYLENTWASHPLLRGSFMNLEGCTSKLNLH